MEKVEVGMEEAREMEMSQVLGGEEKVEGEMAEEMECLV